MVGSPPPWLRLPKVLGWAYVAMTLAAAYLAVSNGWYGIVAAFFMIVAMMVAKRYLPHVPPPGFTTFWDVARRRASVGASIAKGIEEVDLFAALQNELSCALGVETSEVRRGTRLKEDLDVG